MNLELKSVTKSFGSKKALDDVTTVYETGHIYGLLGRNGAGKSTMIKLCTNMIYPTSGAITLDGNQYFDNPSLKRNIFALGEENPLVSDEKVYKVFRQAAEYGGHDSAEMDDLA